MSKIAEAAAEFYAAGVKYAEFGASDTEPRAEFRELLEGIYDTFEGYADEPKIPSTIRDWQLFSGMKGAGEAAKALTAAARKAATAAYADRLALARYLETH